MSQSTASPNPAGTILTISGACVDVLEPRAEDVKLEDVAAALACICRFGGHVAPRFYSVAEHALLVAALVALEHPDDDALIHAALHHDDAKAYLGELATPVAEHAGQDRLALVAQHNAAIAEAFGFDVALLEHPAIAKANAQANDLEAAHLCPHPASDWARPGGLTPQPPAGVPWVGGLDPEQARMAWLARANELPSLVGYGRHW